LSGNPLFQINALGLSITESRKHTALIHLANYLYMNYSCRYALGSTMIVELTYMPSQALFYE